MDHEGPARQHDIRKNDLFIIYSNFIISFDFLNFFVLLSVGMLLDVRGKEREKMAKLSSEGKRIGN